LAIIFSYLLNDTRDLFSCCLVCKHWHDCVSSQGETVIFKKFVEREIRCNSVLLTGKNLCASENNIDLAFVQNLFMTETWKDTFIHIEKKKSKWFPNFKKPLSVKSISEEVIQLIVTKANEILTLSPKTGVSVWKV
jgi:hypothetical protein